jgi:ComF family protein
MQIEKNRSLCGTCDEVKDYPLNKIRSSLWFTEEAKIIMHLVKFQNRFEWLHVFEEYLQAFPFPYVGRGFTCVPVPIHNKKFLTRGFNQSEIFVNWIAKRFFWEISLGLEKTEETPPQSILSKKERRSNLASAFKWNSNFKIPEKIILVDDILTTGETLKACAKVLKAQGVKEVYGWTVFRAKPLKEISLKGFEIILNQ